MYSWKYGIWDTATHLQAVWVKPYIQTLKIHASIDSESREQLEREVKVQSLAQNCTNNQPEMCHHLFHGRQGQKDSTSAKWMALCVLSIVFYKMAVFSYKRCKKKLKLHPFAFMADWAWNCECQTNIVRPNQGDKNRNITNLVSVLFWYQQHLNPYHLRLMPAWKEKIVELHLKKSKISG